MDRNHAMEDDRRMLRRIVTLLFWFAWTARFSCVLPVSARAFMLGVLRRAEIRAYDFVVDMAADHGAPLPACLLIPSMQSGNSPADAMRLAQTFRALAVLLGWLADQYPATGNHCATFVGGPLSMVARLSIAATRLALSHRRSTSTHLTIPRLDSS